MHRSRRLACCVVAVGAAIPMAVVSQPVGADAPVRVLLDGLSSPKGVSISSDGRDPVIGQGAFGPPGPVLRFLRSGPGKGTAVEVGPVTGLMDLAVRRDGSGWGIGADRVLYLQDADGTVHAVLDIAAYQVTDPDPYDVDGDGDGSNPYGLAVLSNGDALIADAQNNDILRVKPDGRVFTVARFRADRVRTDHLGDPTLPPKVRSEAVPTGIAIGADGYAYISELRGFPFRPGSSRVWRLDPWARDAECSNASSGDCSVAMRGFTALVDVAIDRTSGAVYTLSLGDAGVIAFEEGFATGVFPPAKLVRIAHGHRHELASGMLSQPGGVAVARDGAVFVTDGMFTGGRLLQVRT